MPPFVPPSHPPALIKPVASPCDRLASACFLTGKSKVSRQSSLLIADTRSASDSLESPPPVVEFYFADPQAVPQTPTHLPAHEGTAQELGQPITAGESQSQSVSVGDLPAQALVIPGLSYLKSSSHSDRTSHLVTRQRGGQTQQFFLSAAPDAAQTVQVPDAEAEDAPSKEVSVVELIADRQEYDSVKRVVYAQGNVVMRFANGTLLADRLQVNLNDRFAVAQGQVILQRGDQTLRGERFEYYFVQDSGVIFNANGELYQPTTGRDFAPSLPTDVATDLIPNATLNERLATSQPLQRVTTAGGINYSVGNPADVANVTGLGSTPANQTSGGTLNRIRFQAERLEFDGDGWRATNARLTNDPFSPPEVEIRAEQATYRNIAPLVDVIELTNSRIVFDQENSFPTQDRLVIDQRDRQPGVISFGYDGEDRGGLYVERGFNVIDTDTVSWEIKPQYLIQKALFPDAFPADNPTDQEVSPLSPSVFGLVTNLEATLGDRTSLYARTSFSSLDLNDISEFFRAKIFLQQKVDPLNITHDLRLEYNYRERLFNGSLGFQTVQSSFGLILVSPTIPLGSSGFYLSYQGSLQQIEAPTDQLDLLTPPLLVFPDDFQATLVRVQGAASLFRPFTLWQGEALPPTPEEGLRYTPTPVQPFLQLATSVTGVTSFYSNGGSQPSLTGSIGLLGQFGHFSRPWLDYTGFNIAFSQALRGDASPFFFDRFVDTQTVSWGLTQQIYGPVRFGIQSSFNLETNDEINTDYFLEYSRRTYSLLLRYNPVLEIGSINLRISDFNWSGNPGPFDGTGIRPVIQGVTR